MGRNIALRRYRLLSDFSRVHDFLADIYSVDTLNSYLLPQFFEYAHTHPFFNHKLTHRFGLWEDSGKLVGIACYEMDVGESFLVTDPDYDFLLPDMLKYAEKELYVSSDGNPSLSVWVTDREGDKIDLLSRNGYEKVYNEPVRIFSYTKPFPDIKLPNGYKIISLEDENDYVKIHECLWKGFNHGDTPDDDIDSRMHMQSGPNFRKNLTTVIKAPNGDYACFAGMWFDEKNKYAYLEPLATVPEHRRMGLATIALTVSMRKTKALGATYCFGGVPEFYSALGFKTQNRPLSHLGSYIAPIKTGRFVLTSIIAYKKGLLKRSSFGYPKVLVLVAAPASVPDSSSFKKVLCFILPIYRLSVQYPIFEKSALPGVKAISRPIFLRHGIKSAS